MLDTMDNSSPPAAGPRRRSRLLRWGIGVTAAAALVLAGAVVTVSLTDAGATANTALTSASSHRPGGAAAGPCRRLAAELRAAGHPRAARIALRICRRRALLVLLRHAVHGRVTVRTKNGFRTLAFERGVVDSVSATAIVVRAPDGTTWRWDLVGRTVVRRLGHRVGVKALSRGEHVFAGGPVIRGSNDARLIVIRAAGRAAGSPSVS
jgi:hypothetical protein